MRDLKKFFGWNFRNQLNVRDTQLADFASKAGLAESECPIVYDHRF